MIIHGTPRYQISLIYRKRQKGYDSDTITLKKYQLFDLKVKGQRQNVVMLVHDTPSHDHTPTYQISLTYLKRQKSYGPTVNLQIHSD
jgi:proteasome assembly chaperone (PAC2) family protein